MISPNIETRRSARIRHAVPVHISGTDVRGRDFIVRTLTSVLSRFGARIILKQELLAEQEVVIYCPSTGKEESARIVKLLASESAGYAYGVELLSDEKNFWDIPFPPAVESQN